MPSHSGSDDDGSLVHVPAVDIRELRFGPNLTRPQITNGKLLLQGQNLVIPPLPTRSPLRPPPPPSRVPSDSALREALTKQLPGSPATVPTTPTSFSKRKHALLELLSSERAFASDLALIRDIHIPLALGQSAGFTLPGIATPPASSSSSTRTVSTGSDSPATPSTALGPPMMKEDVKAIFGNIEDIAQFADFFSEKLESALGGLIEGGSGEDAVGALFLEVIPVMTPHYSSYITRHPGALAHFQALSANSTPAFSAYLTQTRALVSSHTHAWDIPSLLIKPVQRLLKYPLLLSTIIEDTPDSHGDKENLQIARQNMQEAARGVNEGRRRWEVVKGVLDGKAPSLNAVGRMRSFRLGGNKVKGTDDDDSTDIAAVEGMEKRLKEFEKVMKAFGKESLIWIRSVKATITSLREWSERFGLVLGVGVDSSSDALNAFNEVLEDRLLSLCNDLESTLHTSLIPQLKKLAATIAPPMLLISTLHNLRPSHVAFLNLPVAKSKTAATLMQASMSYQAIHAQLRHELPIYLRLLDTGFGAAITQFAAWQQKFWEETYARWSELWVALEISSTDASGEETVRIWWSRFEEAELELMKLGVLSRRIYKNHTHSKSSSSSVVLVSPVSQTHSINSNPRRPSLTSGGRPSLPSLSPIPHSRSQSLSHSEPFTQPPSRARSSERPATMESRPRQVRHREDWSTERGRESPDYAPQEYHTHYPYPPPMPRMKGEPAHPRGATEKRRPPQLRDSGYQESRQSIVSTRTSNSTNRDSMNLATNVSLQLGALSPSMSRFSSNPSGGTSRARKNVKDHTRLTDDSSQRGLPRSVGVYQQEVALVPNQPNQRRKNSQPPRFEDDIIHYSSTTSKTMRGFDNHHQRLLRGLDQTVGGGSVKSPTKRSQTVPKHVRSESERGRRAADDPPAYRSRALTAETYHRPTADHAELVRRHAEPTELNTISTTRNDNGSGHRSDRRDSVNGLPVLFHCVVVQSFEAPPPHIKYQSFPFLTLRIDDVVQVVYDGGHPADHEHLPIEVDETEAETLFLLKDDQRQIGWGLASSMVPIA